MKNRIRVLCVFIALLLLCGGCGSASYPPNARSVVNAFLSALSDGDVENALEYCEENNDAYITLESATDKNIVHEFATQIASDPENQKQIEANKYIQELLHAYIEYMFKNYQIVEYDEKERDAIYIISISRLDESSSVFNYLTGSSTFDDYYYDHQEELEKLYEDKGEEAVMMKYINDQGKELTGEYMANLKNGARYSNQKYRITLKKNDSRWKILTMEKW